MFLTGDDDHDDENEDSIGSQQLTFTEDQGVVSNYGNQSINQSIINHRSIDQS